MSRLLTEEEIIQLITAEQKRQGVPDEYNFPEAIALSAPYDQVLIEAQDKATLKAVGEWLEKKPKSISAPVYGDPEVVWSDVEAFKHGEMPEG